LEKEVSWLKKSHTGVNPPKLLIFIGLLFFLLTYIRFKDKIELIDKDDRSNLRILGVISFFSGFSLAFLYPILNDNPKNFWSSFFIYLSILLIYLSFSKYSINIINKMSKMGKITLLMTFIFLTLSILIYLSNNAVIYGKIIDSEDKPVAQTKVQIGNLSTFSDIHGEYEIDDGPIDSSFIKFIFP
jgi:hypothetical protein